MFENLTERLSRTVTQLRGKGRLTEDGIRETLREVRIALLEAIKIEFLNDDSYCRIP